MSITFALKGNTGRRVHTSFSRTKLEIRGHFSMSGPQPVGGNGCPEWIADLFDANPNLTQIALGNEESGIVYQRIPETIL